MAWLEIIRKKRSYPDSAKYGQELSFPGVRVVGGSMTSPVTFVSHWELSKNYKKNLKVCFQAESSKLKIEKTPFDKDGKSFILEATYDSLHDTIIVQKTDACVTLNSIPKFMTMVENIKKKSHCKTHRFRGFWMFKHFLL